MCIQTAASQEMPAAASTGELFEAGNSSKPMSMTAVTPRVLAGTSREYSSYFPSPW